MIPSQALGAPTKAVFALTHAAAFNAEFWVALLVRAILACVAEITCALASLQVAQTVLAAIVDAQVVLARRAVVTLFAFTGASGSVAFTMPTTSREQLCHCIVEWTRNFGNNLDLQGKRYVIPSGALFQTAVSPPSTNIARTSAVVAKTIAVTVFVAGSQFARRGVPTLIAQTHKIFLATANTMAVTILRANHFTAVITFSARTPPRVTDALPIVAMTVQIACFCTLFH